MELGNAMKIVKSIVKASKVLELFSVNNKSISLGDIAQSLGMDKATTSHIVSTLVMQGLLKQQKKRGKYSLGVRILDLGQIINSDNKDGYVNISYLTDLSRLINETVNLTVWNGSIIRSSRSPEYDSESCRVNPLDWRNAPLHCTAMGKLVLSGMSDEDLNKYFHSKPLEKNTLNTIINVDKMKEHLLSIKHEGIALEIGEDRPDVNCIAAGIRDPDTEIIGAIFIVGPAQRLTQEVLCKIMPSVKLCALKISRDLGYQSGG
jgi:IclR family transcriptional regulator, KDG regulon repressor